jgi:hypothetical protein
MACRLGLLILAAASVTACTKQDLVGGSTKQAETTIPTDGFLPQPALLAANTGVWSYSYLKPGVDFGAYTSVYIAPVAIMSGPASQLANLPQDQRLRLANTFYSDVYGAVKKSCKVAARPGRGVVSFKLALSDATASDTAVKTVATYAPYLGTVYSAGSFAFNGGVGYFSGTATAEGYATDGATGALLWQGVDKRGGNVPIVQDTTDNWLDVHHVFETWAEQMVQRLQQLGICPPPA